MSYVFLCAFIAGVLLAAWAAIAIAARIDKRHETAGDTEFNGGQPFRPGTPPQTIPAAAIAGYRPGHPYGDVHYFARLARDQQAYWQAETAAKAVARGRAAFAGAVFAGQRLAAAVNAVELSHLQTPWTDETGSFKAFCEVAS